MSIQLSDFFSDYTRPKGDPKYFDRKMNIINLQHPLYARERLVSGLWFRELIGLFSLFLWKLVGEEWDARSRGVNTV